MTWYTESFFSRLTRHSGSRKTFRSKAVGESVPIKIPDAPVTLMIKAAKLFIIKEGREKTFAEILKQQTGQKRIHDKIKRQKTFYHISKIIIGVYLDKLVMIFQYWRIIHSFK